MDGERTLRKAPTFSSLSLFPSLSEASGGENWIFILQQMSVSVSVSELLFLVYG
jgi:hypothetical protein